MSGLASFKGHENVRGLFARGHPTFGGNRLLVCPEPILDRFWADVGCFSGDFSLNFDFIEEAYVGRFWDDF